MRARFYLTFASTMSLSLLGIVTAAPGCGDTEDAAATPTSSDATTDGKASGDAKSDAAPIECLDADITQFTVPDAAAGDSGVNVGACVGCIKTNCTSELQGCQADCDRRDSVIGVFACVGQGKALTACGAGLLSAGSAATLGPRSTQGARRLAHPTPRRLRLPPTLAWTRPYPRTLPAAVEPRTPRRSARRSNGRGARARGAWCLSPAPRGRL